MADAARRASAHYVNAVIPYFGYARQDRKAKPREPITAKLVANILTHGGIDRVVTADLHTGQIQGFFDIPVDHLTGMKIMACYFKNLLADELAKNKVVVVSPDAGGVARAIGNIKGRAAILVDDIIDTAGSICHAADGLKERGADKILACATHAVLSGDAINKIQKSAIEKLIFSDTIPLSDEKKINKIEIVSIAPLFAEAIRRIHGEESISGMFDD